MKQSIEWHTYCLSDLKASTMRQRERVKNEIAHLNRLEEELIFMQKQIDEATRRGLDAFDPRRFLVKRTKKEN